MTDILVSARSQLYPRLTKFLTDYKCPDNVISNFGSTFPPRKLHVNRLNVEQFWRDYASLKGWKCITEYQYTGYSTILVDWDLDLPTQMSDYQINKRISEVCESLRRNVRKFLACEFGRKNALDDFGIAVFKKPPREKEGEIDLEEGTIARSSWHHGFHLQVPEILLEKETRVEFHALMKSDHPELDKGATVNPWLCYGSGKTSRSTPYTLEWVDTVDGNVDPWTWFSKLYGLNITENNIARHLSPQPYVDYSESSDPWAIRAVYCIVKSALGKSLAKKTYEENDGQIAEYADTISTKVTAHLTKLGVIDEFEFDLNDVDGGFCKLNRLVSGICPIDGKFQHDRLGGWICCNGKTILLGCYSEGCKGRHKRFLCKEPGLKYIKSKKPKKAKKRDLDMEIFLDTIQV